MDSSKAGPSIHCTSDVDLPCTLGVGGRGGGEAEYNYIVSHVSEKLALSTTEQPKLYVGQCNPMQLVDLQGNFT